MGVADRIIDKWNNGWNVPYTVQIVVWGAGFAANVFAALQLSGVAAVCVVGVGSLPTGVFLHLNHHYADRKPWARNLWTCIVSVFTVAIMVAMSYIGYLDVLSKAQGASPYQ